MSITFRLIKGTPLTDQELDDNFRYVYEWNNSNTYKAGMFLLYVTNGILYRAKIDVPANVIPGSESDPTTYWQQLGPASDFSFDGTREITRVGIPNVTPGGTTAKQFLENFFYPSVAPELEFSLTNPIREFGASNSVAFPYTVTKHTKGVASITINGVSVTVGSNINEDADPDGNQQSGTSSSTVTQNVDATISGNVSTAIESVSKEVTIKWQGKKFLIASSVDYFTPSGNDATISTALNGLGSGFSLSDDRLIDAPITCSAQYLYFLYLDSMGGDASVDYLVNGMVNDSMNVKTFTYTNQYGYTSVYRLVQSQNILTGKFLIQVR